MLQVAACSWLAPRWGRGHAPSPTTPYYPSYVDVAVKAGLTAKTVISGHENKDFLLSTTGGGVALFDYDNDGWLDIFLANGWGLGQFPEGQEPTSRLYRNNHDGTFTDVTQRAGLVQHGWAQGVCVGDIDNDGNLDLFVTYYGKNVLYRNNGDGTFTDVTKDAGLLQAEDRYNTGRLSWTSIATATWTFLYPTMSDTNMDWSFTIPIAREHAVSRSLRRQRSRRHAQHSLPQ